MILELYLLLKGANSFSLTEELELTAMVDVPISIPTSPGIFLVVLGGLPSKTT